MSYLRQEIKKSGTYLTICENYRDSHGKIVRKVLFNLGKLESYNPEALKRIAEKLYALAGGDIRDLLINNHDIIEISRKNYGFPLVCSYMMRKYQLDVLFDRIKRHYDLKYNLYNNVLLMICNRFNDPLSKLGCYNTQDEYLDIPNIDLHTLYRTLDKLDDNSSKIQKWMYGQHRNLFNYEIDVVFYDVTTFYFESSKEEEGGIRQFGFGKDGKIGDTQILFGLLVDRNKQPIGYRIYDGSTYEGHTFADMVADLRNEYSINRVIVVADRGMMNEDNIKLFGDGENQIDYGFIVGERLKNLSKEDKSYLVNFKNYIPYTFEKDGEKITNYYCIYKKENKTIIGTYSQKRADKDRYERERKIEKGKHLLKSRSEINKKPSTYYLKQVGKTSYVLDEKRITESEKYDGYLCIATNEDNLDTHEIVSRYKDLWHIEQAFRTFKTYLETRPMFHWTNGRIRGHICLCYLSYCLLNSLQIQLKQANLSYSENKIWKTLTRMQVSHIEQTGNHYYLRSRMDEQTDQLLNILKIKPMNNLTPINTS
jgi:transposase